MLDGICFLVNFRFAGRETARGSNPRHDQNLIYFDLSKLAQRPLLGRDEFMDYRHFSISPRWTTFQSHFAVKQPDRIAKVYQLVKFG